MYGYHQKLKINKNGFLSSHKFCKIVRIQDQVVTFTAVPVHLNTVWMKKYTMANFAPHALTPHCYTDIFM